MKANLVKIIQIAAIPFFFLLLHIVLRRRNIMITPKDFENDKSYVVVANHRGMPDPFVIGYGFPISLNLKLTPWRFFVQNRFFKNPLLLPFLAAFGCFPARKEISRPSGLDYGLKLMVSGQNLVIFPEGKISRYGERILPKTGVEVLANQADTLLVPARVSWRRRRWLLKSYSLSIGRPFNGKNMTTEQIMDIVYSLKFR